MDKDSILVGHGFLYQGDTFFFLYDFIVAYTRKK